MAVDPKIPKTREWVQDRAKCSVETLFAILDEVVQSDVKAADERGGRSTGFKITRPTVTKLIVVREHDAGGVIDREGVVFERVATGIAVKESNSQTHLFTATPTVDPVSGDCMFAVDKEVLYAWQVSKKALEKLFFEYGLSPNPIPD